MHSTRDVRAVIVCTNACTVCVCVCVCLCAFVHACACVHAHDQFHSPVNLLQCESVYTIEDDD